MMGDGSSVVTRASNVFVCIKLRRRLVRMNLRMTKRMMKRLLRIVARMMKRTLTNLVLAAQKAPLSILAHGGYVSKENIATPFLVQK